MPLKDKKKRAEYKRRYYHKNREHILKQRKQYRKENQGKMREYCNKYYYGNRRKILRQIKQHRQESQSILHWLKINGCAICGYNKCDMALLFHHTNPKDKKFCINFRHIGDKNLIEEINKCILLCANCHQEIHNRGNINDYTMR